MWASLHIFTDLYTLRNTDCSFGAVACQHLTSVMLPCSISLTFPWRIPRPGGSGRTGMAAFQQNILGDTFPTHWYIIEAQRSKDWVDSSRRLNSDGRWTKKICQSLPPSMVWPCRATTVPTWARDVLPICKSLLELSIATVLNLRTYVIEDIRTLSGGKPPAGFKESKIREILLPSAVQPWHIWYGTLSKGQIPGGTTWDLPSQNISRLHRTRQDFARIFDPLNCRLRKLCMLIILNVFISAYIYIHASRN